MKTPDFSNAMDLSGLLGERTASLEFALDSLEEALGWEHEFEGWVEWANSILPFMHQHGRMKYVVGFS